MKIRRIDLAAGGSRIPRRLLAIAAALALPALLLAPGPNDAPPRTAAAAVSGGTVYVPAAPVGVFPATDKSWLMYRGNLAHTGAAPAETSITKDSVGRLTERWKLPLTPNLPKSQTGVFATPALAYGNAYVGSMDGYFHAIRLSDGAEIWKQFTSLRTSNPRQENGISSSAAILGDTVYVGGDDASVWAFDVATGAVRWRRQLSHDPAESVQSSPMILNDRLYIGVANGNDEKPCTIGRVVALATDTGAILWERPLATTAQTGAGLWSTVAIDPATNRLFAATGNACLEPDDLAAGGVTGQADMSQNLPWDNSVVALDLQTGAVIWVYKFLSGNNDNLDFGASPVLVNDLVVSLSKSGELLALYQKNGEESWKTRVAVRGGSPFLGGGVNSPSFANNRVLVGSGTVDNPPDSPGDSFDASFLSLNPINGDIQWRINLKATPFGASAAANGMVFIGDSTDLLTLDVSNGNTLKRIPAGARLWGGIALAGGLILAGDDAGVLHCYAIG